MVRYSQNVGLAEGSKRLLNVVAMGVGPCRTQSGVGKIARGGVYLQQQRPTPQLP